MRTTFIALLAASALIMAGQASARNLSYSAGKGVKCSYVLVSSVNGVNTWQTVCRKSGV
jgi:hypothetical protein